MVFAICGVVFTGRSVIKPLKKLVQTMGQLAGGDLTVEVLGQKRGDEVGAMAKARAGLQG